GLVAQEPVEALGLEREKVRDLQGLTNLREAQTARCRPSGGHSLVRSARGSQGWSFHRPNRSGYITGGPDPPPHAPRIHTVGAGGRSCEGAPGSGGGAQGSAKRQHTRQAPPGPPPWLGPPAARR